MPILSTEVNLIPILIGTAFNMILGFLWYSNYLFGNPWMRLMGLTNEAIMERSANNGMWKNYLLTVVTAFLQTYILALVIHSIGVFSFSNGVIAGLVIWLGFTVPLGVSNVIWENKSWKLFLINSGYYATTLAFVGGIIAVWI